MLSGHKDALDLAQRAATAKGALKVLPLAVSGAFHTPLMKPAQDALVKVRPDAAPIVRRCLPCKSGAQSGAATIFTVTAVAR